MNEYICPKCGNSRWKTKVKDKLFECRKCGYVGNGVSMEEYKCQRTEAERYRVIARQKAEEVIDNTILHEFKLKWYQRLLNWIMKFFKKNGKNNLMFWTFIFSSILGIYSLSIS